jgi:arabinofuranosyltransferase
MSLTALICRIRAYASSDRITIKQAYFWTLLFGAFFIAFVKTAWVSEDAFITFRTVSNALNGYGLTWNPSERVQAFTHPLWFAALLPFTALSGDPYWTSLALSFATLVLTLFLMGRIWGHWDIGTLLATGSLLWSHSFVDYSSSGLENPLTHTLLAAYVLIWLREGLRHRTYLLALLVSLLFLTRPDAIVLVGPSLALHLWQMKRRLTQTVWSIGFGFLPAVLWIAFSLFYYGAPVPNTALAKVQNGLTLAESALQAINYVRWTVDHDMVSAILFLTGLVGGFWDRKLQAFSVGLVLWFAYLFYVGADYMGGRFFSAPLLLASVLIGFQLRRYGLPSKVLLAGYLLASAGALETTVFSPSTFDLKILAESGIADERGFYYQQLGALPALQRGTWIAHTWLLEGDTLKNAPGTYTRCAIGMTGYAAGPGIYWIDPLALTEPFLARLPARTGGRVGHYERAFPAGYLESIVARQNLIVDPALHRLYGDVNLATRAPLSTPGRLAAIWRLNTDRSIYTSSTFDRQAVGLPGVEVKTKSKFSCYGLPYGWDGTWRIDGPPVVARRASFTLNQK